MKELKKSDHKLISWQFAKKVIIALIIIFVFDFFLFPASALASEPMAEEIINISEAVEPVTFNNSLPVNNEIKVKWVGYYTLTAYNSEPAQCDGNPCITANGFNLCEHGVEDSVAANFLKFGTKIRIPGLFGERVFVVRDRMNKRYEDRIDVWMLDKGEAKKFGVKAAKIEVLEDH